MVPNSFGFVASEIREMSSTVILRTLFLKLGYEKEVFSSLLVYCTEFVFIIFRFFFYLGALFTGLFYLQLSIVMRLKGDEYRKNLFNKKLSQLPEVCKSFL